jgi:2-oxoglutarate ferredoxin oxidoreductase subunit beta
VDVFVPHMKTVLKKAAAHAGSAFVEILQNCNIFNDGAWDGLTEKELRDDHTIAVEHGKPLVFGKAKDRGIRMNGLELEVVKLGDGITEQDLIVHDERHPNPAYAFLLSRMDATPGYPTPLGVLRAVDAPVYERQNADQLAAIGSRKGKGDLGRLLRAGDTWEVR